MEDQMGPDPFETVPGLANYWGAPVPAIWVVSDKTRRDGLRIVKYTYPCHIKSYRPWDSDEWLPEVGTWWSATWDGKSWYGHWRRRDAVAGAMTHSAIERLGRLASRQFASGRRGGA